MKAVLLSELITRARRAADMEYGGPVSDSELREEARASVQRLYDLLVAARGQEYYRKTAEMYVVPGQALYHLPSDFYKLLAVLANPSTTALGEATPGTFAETDSRDTPGWLPLAPFEMRELHWLMGRRASHPGECMYRLRGAQWESASGEFGIGSDDLELSPAPGSGWVLRVEYLPVAWTTLDGNDLKLNAINGFEQMIVLETAIYALQKEQSDASHLERRLDQEVARVQAMAKARDFTAPSRIVDTAGCLDGGAGGGWRQRAYGDRLVGGWVW